MKISQVLTGYWLDKKLNFSKHTVNRYEHFFRYLIDFLGDVEFESITTNDIRRFLLHLSEKPNLNRKDGQVLSRRTVHDIWISLMSLWTWAESELKTPHIIRGRIKEPKYDETAVEPFTEDELKRLVKAVEFTKEWKSRTGKPVQTKRATAARDKAIILTLLDTGIRAQELCSLKVRDYDEKRGRLHIRHSKNDRARFVILGNRARKSLWRYQADRSNFKPTDPLFATNANCHLQRDNLRHMLAKTGERSGVVDVYPHRFRHTFAINFLRNGGNLFLLQELLGHSSLEMVRRYSKVAETDIEQAVQFSPADAWKI